MKSFFGRFVVKQRILILLQVLAIPTIIMFIILGFIMNQLIDIEGTIFIENISSIRAAYNLETSLLSLKGSKANYLIDSKIKWLTDFDNNVKHFNYWYNKAFISARTEYEKNILSNMSLDFSQYMKLHEKIIDLADKKKKSEAIRLLLNENDRNYTGIITGCKNLIKENEELIKNAEDRARNLRQFGEGIGYVIIFFFIVFGIALSLVIAKSIVDPINEIIDSTDLIDINEDDNREIRKLKTHFNSMLSVINKNQKQLISAERKASVGQIAAGISHELNNPIGIICGLSEVLYKNYSLQDEGKELIGQINLEAERCKKLLGALLDYARSPEPVFVETDIKSLIRQNIKNITNQEKYSGVKFILKFPRSGVKAYVDSMQISQVLLNIFLNACDAMTNSGTIEITLEKIEDRILIRIRDSGRGIKKEDSEKIFLPFFSTKAKGSGLGLAISRDIIEKHQGFIAVKSEPGQGTEFSISIPEKKNA